MTRALAFSQAAGWSHFLYGATDSTLEALRAAIRATWPRAALAGSLAAPFGPIDDAVERANIETINAADPDIVWVGMGCPKQEEWTARYASEIRARIVVASGAAFDFIAGNKPQAPDWMQSRGLEWLFRLKTEPRRLWRRYLLRNPYFVWQFLLQLLGLRWRDPA
jgi:N-acetylglucosaminyldiphosphoundecaprenol N-acetyl-beta-D-mannosaminyltransferase